MLWGSREGAPIKVSTPFATCKNIHRSGEMIRANRDMGYAKNRENRSGYRAARDLGVISPNIIKSGVMNTGASHLFSGSR